MPDETTWEHRVRRKITDFPECCSPITEDPKQAGADRREAREAVKTYGGGEVTLEKRKVVRGPWEAVESEKIAP